MSVQPLKKKEVKKFSVKDYKNSVLGETRSQTADKPMEWIIMPPAFQDALKLPGFPMGRTSMIRGRSDTGKSTLKNCAIGAAMRQGILPIIFETEGNFDFQYAKDCGMDIEPVYGEKEYVNDETGEVTIKREIIDWEGDYILFTNKKICDFCGNMDYSDGKPKSKKRPVPVIEDIGYIMNHFLEEQEQGRLPMPLLFVWDSVGSIQSWKSYTSKVGNNMFDAGAISVTFSPIFSRIASSKEVGVPYTNTFIVVNKIWTDNANSTGGAVAIANKGGDTFQYAIRLGVHVGGVARAGTKKLKATLKGDEYQYGNITKISVFKNQLPTPYNVTYSGTMCCVHNGIISEDNIDSYKKEHLPLILDKIKQFSETGVIGDINDITFTEEGEVE
jgi:hypothetical protein